MDSARILLAGGGPQSERALRDAFKDGGFHIDVDHTDNVDDTLTAMVSLPFQLCVIRGPSAEPGFALSICEGAKESGARIPIVVLMDIDCQLTETEYLETGALAALPWDGSQSAMLRNIVRLTVVLRKTEESLRTSNDRLVREMLTIQDERERAEAMGTQYVALAEDYALAKEELEKLNQQKNKFFSIIAHDLRSPFTSLLGFTALLEQRAEKLTPDKVKDYAETINSSATRVFKLLENLLEWSRLQMDRVDLAPKSFALTDIAEKTVDVLGPVAAEKGITLTVANTAPEVFADPHMIDAVIRNLVNNAIKFTPKDGTITIAYDTTPTGKILVKVSDTGVGMPQDAIDKIFSLSDNVSTNGTDGEKGTGLGLLLCKELVERNQGKMSIDSTPGEGSTFAFTLPPAPAKAIVNETSAKATAGR